MEANLAESIGIAKATAKAAHSRLDKLEEVIRLDLLAINEKLEEINKTMTHTKGFLQGGRWIIGIMIGLGSALIGAMMTYIKFSVTLK